MIFSKSSPRSPSFGAPEVTLGNTLRQPKQLHNWLPAIFSLPRQHPHPLSKSQVCARGKHHRHTCQSHFGPIARLQGGPWERASSAWYRRCCSHCPTPNENEPGDPMPGCLNPHCLRHQPSTDCFQKYLIRQNESSHCGMDPTRPGWWPCRSLLGIAPAKPAQILRKLSLQKINCLIRHMRLRNSFSTIVQSVLQQRQRHTSHLGSKHEATTYVESHCTLLQLPKKMFHFSCLCSLQKIRLPRPLGACLCYLLPQCCSICGNGLILFKTFQRIEVALAGAEAHCRIERILQPLISTQFCPGHQIIKPLCLHAEIFLHGPIRLCEQSPKFVRLDIEMGSVTSYTVCSSTPLALGAIAAAAHRFQIVWRTVWHNCRTSQSGVAKGLQTHPSQPLAHLSLLMNMHSACLITLHWFFHCSREPHWRQLANGLLSTPCQEVHPFSMRIFRNANIPGKKKAGAS